MKYKGYVIKKTTYPWGGECYGCFTEEHNPPHTLLPRVREVCVYRANTIAECKTGIDGRFGRL